MAFDVVTPAKLGTAPLTSGATTIYTVPAYSKAILKDLDICNNSTSKTNVTVYLVPAGSTPGPTNILIPGVEIPANSIMQWTGTQVLNVGDSIAASSTVLGTNIFASGAEVN